MDNRSILARAILQLNIEWPAWSLRIDAFNSGKWLKDVLRERRFSIWEKVRDSILETARDAVLETIRDSVAIWKQP